MIDVKEALRAALQDCEVDALVTRQHEEELLDHLAPRLQAALYGDRQGLYDRLRASLNAESAENPSGTPDFVLAEYLLDCLAAFDRAAAARARWRGEDVEPQVLGETPVPVVPEPRREPLWVEGLPTEDGRLIARGALAWEEPLPLMALDPEAREGDGLRDWVVAGTVTEIVRSAEDPRDGSTLVTGLLTWSLAVPGEVGACSVDVQPTETVAGGHVLSGRARAVHAHVGPEAWAWPRG